MESKKYKVVFLDLDGTLLPIDMDEFLHDYFSSLRDYFFERGYDGDHALRAVNLGVDSMMNEREGGSNSDRFWNAFEEASDATREEFEPLFETYYQTAFAKIGKDIIPNPAAKEIVEILVNKGYKVYLTTMPLFPEVAVETRLKWAGFDGADLFDRITTYDNSNATKPDLAYYQENLDAAGVDDPSEVLMVGNNTIEDLNCMELGIDAFLVTDWLINSNDFDCDTVKNGTLVDFLEFVKGLPECD